MPSVTLQEASTSSLPMSAQIILFGPQGTEITHALRNVLTRAGIAHHGHDERSNTSIPGHAQQQARNFLLEALTALQIESKHIQRTGLILPHNEGNNYFPTPDVFSSWQRLVEWHAADGYLDPATAGALLCTVQIASLILSGFATLGAIDSSSTSAPSSDIILAGYCTGVLAALALVQSETGAFQRSSSPAQASTDFLTRGLETVRLAFWIGFRAARLTNSRAFSRSALCGGDLDEDSDDESDDDEEPLGPRRANNASNAVWTIATVGLHLSDADVLLNEWHTLTCTKPSTGLYISAVTADSELSISGPPKLLSAFQTWISEVINRRRKADSTGTSATSPPQPPIRTVPLKVFAPYHTMHHGLRAAADLVLEDVKTRQIGFAWPSDDFQALRGDKNTSARRSVFYSTLDGRNVDVSLLEPSKLLYEAISSVLTERCAWDKVQNSIFDDLKARSALYKSSDKHDGSPHVRICTAGPADGLAKQLAKQIEEAGVGGPVNVMDLLSLASDPQNSGAHAEDWECLTLKDEQEDNDLAIISVACRFPGGAKTPEAFWECVQSGRSTASEFPSDRFDTSKYFTPTAPSFHACDDIDLFDPQFFSMSPREAEQMDPQQRLALLVSYEALERAGYAPPKWREELAKGAAYWREEWDKRRIGCWWAVASDDYRHNASHNIGPYFITGNIRAFVPGHISYLNNWEGPSVSVDAGDCSSHAALHQACAALAAGQCDVAVVGGVHVATQPSAWLAAAAAAAAGENQETPENRGEGCGVLVLKRCREARNQGDNILAVVKGVQVGHDPAQTALTAGTSRSPDPAMRYASEAAQTALFERTCAQAGVALDNVSLAYPATHLPSKSLAPDSMQMRTEERLAMQTAFGAQAVQTRFVHPAVGAAEAAIGMAQIISAVMELRTRVGNRSALINSLSKTGSCAAVLLQSAPAPQFLEDLETMKTGEMLSSATMVSSVGLVTLSGRSLEGLQQRKWRLIDWLERRPERKASAEEQKLFVSRLQIATSACCEQHRPFRLAVSASDISELIMRLREAEASEVPKALPEFAFHFRGREELPMFAGDVKGPLHKRDGFWNSFHARLHTDGHSVSERVCRMATLAHQYNTVLGAQPAVLVANDLTALCASLYFAGCLGLAEASQLARAFEENDNVPDEATLWSWKMRPTSSRLRIANEAGVTLVDVDETPNLHALVQRVGAQQNAVGAPAWAGSQQYVWVEIGHERSVRTQSSDETLEDEMALSYGPVEVRDNLKALYLAGVDVNWASYHGDATRYGKALVAELPTYPFQLSRFWIEYRDRIHVAAERRRQIVAAKAVDSAASASANGGQPGSVTQLGRHHTGKPLVSACVGLEEQKDGRVHAEFEVELGSDAASPKTQDLLKACAPVSALAHSIHPSLALEALAEAMVHVNSQIAQAHPGELTTLNVQGYRASVGVQKSGLPTTMRIARAPGNEAGQDVFAVHLGEVMSAKASLTPQTAVLAPKDLHRPQSKRSDKAGSLGKRVFYRVLSQLGLLYASKEQPISIVDTAEDGAWFEARIEPFHSWPNFGATLGNAASLIDVLLSVLFFGCSVKLRGTSKVPTVQHIEQVRVAVGQIEEACRQNRKFSICCRVAFAEGVETLATASVMLVADDQYETPLMLLSGVQVVAADKPKASVARAPAAASRAEVPRMQAVPAGKPTQQALPVVVPSPTSSVAQGRIDWFLDLIRETMGLEGNDGPAVDAPLADLGMDSLMSLSILSVARQELSDLDFPGDFFLEYGTFDAISGWMSKELKEDSPGAHTTGAPHILASTALTDAHAAAGLLTAAVANDAPSEATEAYETIIRILATELGVSENELKPSTSLADCGVDSLTAIVVLSAVREELSLDLPGDFFLTYPRLDDVRAYLSKRFGSSSGGAEETKQCPELEIASPASTQPSRWTTVRTPDSSSALNTRATTPNPSTPNASDLAFDAPSSFERANPAVQTVPKKSSIKADRPLLLQKGPPGRSVNVFLLPDGSGAAAVYAGLPPQNATVWGINNPFMGQPDAWDSGVGQLAALYWESIKMVQPDGAYILGGWSFGGIIGYEMCRQLALGLVENASSSWVQTLLLLDSPCPTFYPPLPYTFVDWIFNSPDHGTMLTPTLEALFKATLRSMVDYECLPLPRSSSLPDQQQQLVRQVLLITATDGVGPLGNGTHDNATVNWMSHSRKGLDLNGWDHLFAPDQRPEFAFQELESANHFTMMKPPLIQRLGEMIRSVL